MESEMEQRQYDECKSCLKNIDTIDRLTAQLAKANKKLAGVEQMYTDLYDRYYRMLREREDRCEL